MGCLRNICINTLRKDDNDDDNNNNNKFAKNMFKIKRCTVLLRRTKMNRTSFEGKVTILWNQQLQTNPTNPNNKPDIKIHDNEKGMCGLIDVAISRIRNVIERVVIKINAIIHQMNVTVLN